jgi:hypothetical protein
VELRPGNNYAGGPLLISEAASRMNTEGRMSPIRPSYREANRVKLLENGRTGRSDEDRNIVQRANHNYKSGPDPACAELPFNL